MTRLLGFFFDSSLGRLAAAAAGLLGLVVAFAWDQRNIGGERAIAKQQRIESRANDVANRAAEQSGAGGLQPGARPRGRRDPTTRDD